jgi:hypothetical protein
MRTNLGKFEKTHKRGIIMINEKAKSYVKFAMDKAQERITICSAAQDLIRELDNKGLEVNYIKEKTGKMILSIGIYNLVVQRTNKGLYYLLFNFETKQKIFTTYDPKEFKDHLNIVKKQ